jgi:hypothetical protein
MPISRGGSHRGINCKFEYFSKFEFIFETALGYDSGGWGTFFYEKNKRQNLLCQCPFKGTLTRDILVFFIIFNISSSSSSIIVYFVFCTVYQITHSHNYFCYHNTYMFY